MTDVMENQIRAFATQWAAAEEMNDVTTLDHLLAEDFAAVGPLGFVLTKAAWLARYRSGELRNTSFALDDFSVRGYGDFAIATARQNQETTYKDKPAGGSFRTTLILRRGSSAEDWRLIGLHLSPIIEAPR